MSVTSLAISYSPSHDISQYAIIFTTHYTHSTEIIIKYTKIATIYFSGRAEIPIIGSNGS